MYLILLFLIQITVLLMYEVDHYERQQKAKLVFTVNPPIMLHWFYVREVYFVEGLKLPILIQHPPHGRYKV